MTTEICAAYPLSSLVVVIFEGKWMEFPDFNLTLNPCDILVHELKMNPTLSGNAG